MTDRIKVRTGDDVRDSVADLVRWVEGQCESGTSFGRSVALQLKIILIRMDHPAAGSEIMDRIPLGEYRL